MIDSGCRSTETIQDATLELSQTTISEEHERTTMDTTTPTFTLSFHHLAVLKTHDNRRYPLEMLAPGNHIHGELRIQINGRNVPRMGYWSVDDVCFAQWIAELTAIRTAFRGDVQAIYTFDEGEQGQPAFKFVRNGDTMMLSIVASKIPDGHAHREWQNIAFQYKDFVQSYEMFKLEFLDEISRIAPKYTNHWKQLFR